MTTLREAAEQALKTLEESCFPRASAKHSKQYDDAIACLEKALSERQECETCAAKRKKLQEAGLLKSPLREIEE
jgi:hypothetical protein